VGAARALLESVQMSIGSALTVAVMVASLFLSAVSDAASAVSASDLVSVASSCQIAGRGAVRRRVGMRCRCGVNHGGGGWRVKRRGGRSNPGRADISVVCGRVVVPVCGTDEFFDLSKFFLLRAEEIGSLESTLPSSVS